MDIRQATITDCAAILAIWNPVIRTSDITFNSVEKTPEVLAEEITQKTAAGQPFLVAVQGAQVLGFATYGPFRGSNGYVHSAENTIYLADSAQGKGLGRQLLVTLEARARAGDIHVMVAGMTSTNITAQEFHRALGYDEVGRMPEVGTKFGRKHELVLMQKRL